MTNLHDAKTRLREAIEQCADDEMSPTMRADIKCVLDAFDGQTIILPDGVRIEIIKPSGEAFAVYQDAVRRADEAIGMRPKGDPERKP